MQASSLSLGSTKLLLLKPLLIFQHISRFSYAFKVCLRFFIAIVGGYFFTAVSCSLLSAILPLNKADAVLMSVSLSILIYTLVFIYAFYVKSLKTVWISILLATAAQLSLLALIKGWV
ncbi:MULTISPECIES: hypothetical protein [Pseudoalteromonas]|uniref:Membrane protein n=2 Tax=Pseudoalteromonas translucida TaxID=166935 RepID=Q3ICR0_PSET1|nr:MULTISPECIES: hypothetical protein [Pseudoalteromonas]ALS34579.1 hypothetical protein PTRA_b0037 [Pseudoalteromonas translucida KMM 520]MBB1407380.1 hypothetical protein [Pseudoalteromonas sp. SG44-5]MBE0420819.1 hypothetical protein [Pseudoalteromonas nigrifaciens]MBH0073808.1 hypothetical protein [Pseudoalteromonas sp. NZS127]MBH0091292.1 hypothetical protein [Pseudoalteromonas sp. SCQQ13]|tara:strand:+ start:700 stop:1053 length:354 start_codon:yes stop_codon:yes gene_type:complete